MKHKEKSMASAIVYLGEDAAASADFCMQICEQMESVFEVYELVVVSDCREHAAAAVKQAHLASGREAALTIVNLSVRQGVERAMNAGIDIAIGDYLYEFDNVDAALPDGIVAKAFATATGGYDIVTAKPQGVGKLGSRLFYGLFNRYSESGSKLGTDGFHLLSRRAVNRLHAINPYIPYRKAAHAASGMRMTDFVYTPAGVWKAAKDDRVGKATDALILYTDAAYRLSVTIALIMLVLAFASGIYTLVVYLSAQPVAGWTTTMAVISAGFSGVFLLFAVVIKYLSLLVDLTFRNQKYLVASVDKVQNE